jgi:hypothetical protein
MSNTLSETEITDLFSGVEDVGAKFQTNYAKEGSYVLVITEASPIKTRKEKTAVVVGLRVIQVLDTPEGVDTHSVGEDFTWMQQRNKGSEGSFLARIKSFIGHTAGENPDNVTMGDCRAMTSPEQPMTGFVVKTRQYKKDAEKPWVDIDWSHMSAEDVVATLSPEEITRFLPGGAVKNTPAAGK